jgi:hypothetical protein
VSFSQSLLQRAIPVPHQSLCAEMTEELCFTLRCHGSRQRPALKRQCSKCIPGTTYVPAGLELPPHPPSNGLHSQVIRVDSKLISVIAQIMLQCNTAYGQSALITTIICEFLPLGVASCCASIQLVPYDAVNRNKVSMTRRGQNI